MKNGCMGDIVKIETINALAKSYSALENKGTRTPDSEDSGTPILKGGENSCERLGASLPQRRKQN